MPDPITHAVQIEKHEPPEFRAMWLLQTNNGLEPYLTQGYEDRDRIDYLASLAKSNGRQSRIFYVPSEAEAAQQRRVEEAKNDWLSSLDRYFGATALGYADTLTHDGLVKLVNHARAAYEAAKQAAKGGGSNA